MQQEVKSNKRNPLELIELITLAKKKISEFEVTLGSLEDELITSVDDREVDIFGSKTFKCGEYKVVVTKDLNVSVPAADILKMENEFKGLGIPLNLMPFKMKPSFNETAFKVLAAMSETTAHKIASKYVVSKPAKAKVKIEV